MAIIAGIDEAGLGPVLGPLVVSVAAFEVPDDRAEVPLWDTLSAAVSRKPVRGRTRIAIGDSKKLYNRQSAKPLEHLERAVLAALAAAGRTPGSLQDLLEIVAPGLVETLGLYPWYGAEALSMPLPRCLTESQPSLAGNALSAAMSDTGVRLTAIRSEVICVGAFNEAVRATRNKSTTAGDVSARLLYYLWNKSAGCDLHVFVDRQGGRMHYLPSLQRIWPEGQFKVLDESETSSGYRVSDGSSTAEIWYRVSAEESQLPVALASMTSKYVREVMMEQFNDYWRQRVGAALAPTAGYHVDGQRFFKEITPVMQQLGISEEIVYRSR